MMDVCRGGEILALIGKGCPYQKVGGEAGALRPSNSSDRCSRERPDPRATSGAPTNPLELFTPELRLGPCMNANEDTDEPAANLLGWIRRRSRGRWRLPHFPFTLAWWTWHVGHFVGHEV